MGQRLGGCCRTSRYLEIMSSVEKGVWNAFAMVVPDFLGNKKLGANTNVNVQFLHSSLKRLVQ